MKIENSTSDLIQLNVKLDYDDIKAMLLGTKIKQEFEKVELTIGFFCPKSVAGGLQDYFGIPKGDAAVEQWKMRQAYNEKKIEAQRIEKRIRNET